MLLVILSFENIFATIAIFFFCFETSSFYLLQDGLKFIIFLPQPSKCCSWNYKYIPLAWHKNSFNVYLFYISTIIAYIF